MKDRIKQVDGIVHRSEEGAKFFVESTIPSVCKHRTHEERGKDPLLLFFYMAGHGMSCPELKGQGRGNTTHSSSDLWAYKAKT